MFTRRGLSGLTAGITALAAAPAAAAAGGGAATLAELQARLAKLPAKRDFKTVPLVLDSNSLWDDAAIREVAAYHGGPRQVLGQQRSRQRLDRLHAQCAEWTSPV